MFPLYISIVGSLCLLVMAFLYAISDNRVIKIKETKLYLRYLGFILTIEIGRNLSAFIFSFSIVDYLYILYLTGEFYLLFNLFHKALQTPQTWRVGTAILAGCFFVETASLWLIFDNPNMGYSKVISHVLISIATGVILLKYLKEIETDDPFWIIYASLFLYYITSLLLFMFMEQLTEKNVAIWAINNLLSCILYGNSIYVFYSLKHAR